MDNSINQEAIVDDNASVNNNLPVNPPILNDATNHNPPSFNDIFNGGGIHKMKKHLAKITGDVKKCPKVPYDVEKQIKSLLKEIQTNKNKRKVSFSEEGGDEVIHEVDKWFAQWLLDCKIPFNAVMLPFFQDMLDCVIGIGPGYKGPSYDKLRIHLLADLKRECQMLVDSYRSAWRKTGCTLMADDASSIIKNASHLYSLFSEVIEWIHSNDIVHVVTDNAANYVVVGRLINKKYDNIIKRPNWREIVRPGATCFATVFIILKSIFERKVDLLVDADDKPSLGYIYEGMLKANDAIKEIWDKHLKKNLHAAAYFLNPAFFFNENYKEAPDVMRSLIDLVTLYCKYNNLNSIEAMKELHLYRDRKESFDRPEAIRAASKLKPGDIDADLYQSDDGSSGLYAASLNSSAQEGGNEGEDDPTEANLQQILADFDD
ncbi:uncharacterized protein LOC107494119 [Arachis duranensis]|uniref:Uncharacterized protein LOC107494119 n=1 Tax=Arachis duranensis TaxID=130453 RepID=A0A6P4DQJ0_ARADU|nr:uncharacterized protein LOC107494119 [Arachis duranensis]